MKEFNKYSLQDLVSLLEMYHGMHEISREVQTTIATKPEKLLAQLISPYFWSKVYELPFMHHLALLIDAAGYTGEVIQAAASDDPQAAALAWFAQEYDEAPQQGPEEQEKKQRLLALLFSMDKTVESMVTHGKFIDELVRDVKKGNDQALFKAVQIDRTVTSCPPIADRITLAEMTQDEGFFKKLSNAIRTKPKKPKEEYAELRYVLYALEDADALGKLSTERAYRLFCEELAIYPADGEDPARSLQKFIARWKKARAT